MVLLEKDCYQFMVRGSNLHKVKNSNSKITVNTSLLSGGTPQHYNNAYSVAENPSQQSSSQVSGKKFARSFKLDPSHNFISWSPSRKGQRYAQYEVRRFARIRRGLISVEVTQNGSANSSNAEENSANNSFARLGFTIIFVNGTTCELLASNAETVNYWVTGLRFLIYRCQQGINSHLPVEKERHVRTEFKTKSYGAQNLDFHSAIELFHDLTPLAGSLNLPYALERVFKHGRLISCNDFVSLFDNLTSVGVLLSIVFQYSVSGDLVLNVSELASVLIHEVSEVAYGVASETALSALCRSVVSSFEVVPEYRQNVLLGVDGLTSFFFSRHCGLMDPRHLSVHQDMSRSLSSYYMNSSHNTFLTGSQLLGESSADMYTQLLTRGVRYVEIDVWDGEDGQPFCNHGYTLTSRIPFTHVIQAINQAAFVTSVYPVVIGLENHCCLTQQASLVQTMLSIFREKLFLPKEHSPSGVNVMDLPLNSLCCKILIKSKKLNKTSEFGSSTFLPHSKSEHGSIVHLSSNGQEDDENDEKNSLYDKVTHASAADDCNNSWGEVSDENSADELSDVYKVQPNLRRNEMNEIVEHLGAYDQRRKQHLLQGKAPTIALSSRLSKCVVLRSTALSKHTLRKLSSKNRNLLSKYANPSIHNLPENQAVHVVREQYLELLSFTQNNLVSVSPSPTRIDSSNPELLQFWNGGVQIVALNQQTDDRMNKMNRSLFDANGSSGYFLKPKLLQTDVFNENQDFSCTKTLSMSFLYISIVDQIANYDVMNTSTTSSGNMTSSSHSLSSQSISSSQHSVAASTSQPEFCLRVEILGHPIDTSTHSFACNSKEELREGMRGVKLEYPDLAFIGFSVTDETSLQNRKVLAEFYLPVSSLAQGVRSVNLSGKTPVSILCHVRVEEHVQPSKSSQFSLGILKRASFIKKSLKGSFRRSVGMTGPSNPAPQYDIPTTLFEGNERNVEAVSDRDSGFLSNSSMNSPSRVDRNESPESSQVGQGNLKPNNEPKARFPNQYTNVDPNQVTAQQRSSFTLSEQDKLNIMLEEAAKAEVLLSAEHRKAKSLSMTDEMIRLESEEFNPKPALPPKRYQSFRDKPSGDAKNDQFVRPTTYGNRFDSRKEIYAPARPSSCTIDKNFSSNASISSSQRSLRKQSPSFLYTVSTPSSDTLYKVIEESNLSVADSSNDSSNVVDNNSTRSSDAQGDVQPQLSQSGIGISFESGTNVVPDRRTGRDIVRESWHGEPPELAGAGMTASLNRTFIKQRNSQRSKYMNSTAIQKASFGFRNKMNKNDNAMSLNLETSVGIRKQPPVPPKCSMYTMEAERNRTSHPRSLHQGFDPNKSYSFIDSFCVTSEEPEKEESEMLELTTMDETPKSDISNSPPRFSANLFPRSRFESPQNISSDSPDLSLREGVLNLHEMSVSLPVESVNTSNAVKKSLKTLNQQNLP